MLKRLVRRAEVKTVEVNGKQYTIDIDKVKKIVEKNLNQYNERQEVIDCSVTFISKESGQMIFGPFHDESLRFEVDPIEYYGVDFLESDFCK